MPEHPTRAIAENRWRAAADGVEGELIDLDRARTVDTRRHLARLVEMIGPCVPDARAVERTLRWLDRPSPPAQHRAIAAERGLPGLVGALADVTEAVDGWDGPLRGTA